MSQPIEIFCCVAESDRSFLEKLSIQLALQQQHGSSKIGRISTSGTITEFPVPTSDSSPYGITAGPDGNLWFTEAGGNKIGTSTFGK